MLLYTKCERIDNNLLSKKLIVIKGSMILKLLSNDKRMRETNAKEADFITLIFTRTHP